MYIFWFLHQTTTFLFPICLFVVLYIFWFLHQTTTSLRDIHLTKRCISFDSYIKPQLSGSRKERLSVVYLLIPTSNHNLEHLGIFALTVVYLLIPTSNHNVENAKPKRNELYIFWFLHQTTTFSASSFFSSRLYIFWFLHQTTTRKVSIASSMRCISFDSYIKPQLFK